MNEVRFMVNGQPVEVTVSARLSLADLLRDRLGLTGTHLGCEHGVCGACSVLVDGRSVRACLMLAVQAEGRMITTVEGLHRDGRWRDLQQAMAERHALQCGFCTPGFLVCAAELLGQPGPLDETGVREALSGNVCRCTGYASIVQAVLDTARGRSSTPP
ncbi:(2Fe-2S)-binding protein [Nonomuraea sp. NPDC050451]|uniref:(2Fe-2S)-binding protein n=1 Tax=Nonomuraea sp. NPDC050451 TaxID=3364364 RepID=UPI0037A43228